MVFYLPKQRIYNPVSQNLFTQSQSLGNAAWTPSAIIVNNADIAPDGTMTATTVNDNSTVAFLSISQNINVVAGNYVLTWYIKQTTSAPNLCGFNFGGTNTQQIRFNTNTGVSLGNPTVVTAVGSYWKIVATITMATSGAFACNFFPATGMTSGGDTATATGIQTVWGVSLNKGNFPSPRQVTTANAIIIAPTWRQSISGV